MSSVFYNMDMDLPVTGNIDMIMDSRDILAPFDHLAEESDSEMFLGDDNKENEEVNEDTPKSQPRPSKRATRQPLSTSTKYRLGPRRKLTEEDLDFEIYRDETAHDHPQWRREYYGSNLPALGEIHNGMAEYVWNIAQEEPTNLERLAAAYVWDVDCDALDTWLWVQDKGYDRNWTEHQKERFVEFLQWMKPLMEIAMVVAAVDREEAEHIDEWNNQLIRGQFDSLGLHNLDITKSTLAQVTFVPVGEDENILHRADFTEEDQACIDEQWNGPGRWAPGEEAVPPLEKIPSPAETEWESSEEESEEESDEEDEEEEEPYEIEPGFEGDDLIAF
ncbi:hypothetical protein M431DRAFT_521497 [Trichoderma harzianum CBS 226.95]|uniref:Uncharacterized protein n=1 Tax=Trichoderma harzianum CBS 226.95 TaxID=983964 RepID=A0A2T4A8F2_TRIHA|nr:hypothetical protein M431DRAFT_521497 [Trichoderma harzianum CBS 226.95]PTB53337.1 hypothetical protein M431DRAFT_521497 [Trichoderma harzianum CBS 226.95]